MLLNCQPVGIYAGAAAHLLLPASTFDQPLTAIESYRSSKLLSGNLDVEVPENWQFFVAAARGDIARARELLDVTYRTLLKASSLADEQSLIEEWYLYNRFVLDPSAEAWRLIQHYHQNATIGTLAQVVAFAYGLSDELPAFDCLTGELRAWSMSTLISKQVEQGNYLAARQTLSEAVELARSTSPLLAAIFLSQSAQLAEQCQVPCELIEGELQQAIELAQACALPGFLAELHTQLGMVYQRGAGDDRSKFLAAIRAYQQALQSGITDQSHSDLFAQLQNNLGLCYLSMPQTESSAQLRTGIAIQSFRHGLASIDQQAHPELWARISMNLANALQYAPSSHPAENLVQAIEIYEQVLQVRSRARDPVAYALTIMNQANALAHLGMFKPALEKASEAYKLFQWYDQGEAAASARELVENINEQLARRSPVDTAAKDCQTHEEQQESPHGSVPATAI